MIDISSVEGALRSEFAASDDEVEVLLDRFAGVRIRIVSSSFEGTSKVARRARVLARVDDDDIAALALLAPDEVGTEGDPRELAPEVDLPLWADTLAEASARDQIEVVLASSAQEQLVRPLVTTFYSLRGGVGRSTALAHTAFVLAELGLSVLCVDMDLEAPGLASLLGVEESVGEDRGVVDLLTTIEITGAVPADLTDHFVRIPTNDANHRLELLPAGTASPAYARDLALLDPAAWYREDLNPLRSLLDGIRNLSPTLRPDIVLIDSRTGLSPIAAPLLFDISDVAIITFFPHPQAKVGTGLLTRALLTARTARGQREGRQLTPEPRFVISPVPPSEENAARAQQRAMDWISEWLAPARTGGDAKPFSDLEEIVHVVPYSEEAATSDNARGTTLAHAPYAPIAEWIAGLVETDQVAVTVPGTDTQGSTKAEVLESLDFKAQTADTESVETLRDIFVSTESVTRALAAGTRLVLGRKGTGKTLLFRQMLFDDRIKCVAIASPDGEESARAPLRLGGSEYKSVAGVLADSDSDWQTGWRAIIGLALMRQGVATAPPLDALELQAARSAAYRGGALLVDLRSLLGQPDGEVAMADWLSEVDEELEAPTYLLFDGLDTGFGRDRELRNTAVTGLLLLLNGQARRLKNLRFKVFLREDIFRAVDLPNKSHLRAEAAALAWNDQYDYLRIVIRQAWRSETFRNFVTAALGAQERLPGVQRKFDLSNTEIEFWPDDVVLWVWRIIVGERMSGGKTAFTHNWVWSRLADANEDHAPRHLVTLFHEASSKERALEPGTPYGRALVRPRALADALDRVSDDAVVAVNEEFPELEDLLAELRVIGRTPFEENQLARELLPYADLALEVGVLGRSADGRYRVPELYRRALKMNRQGQQ